MPTPTRKTRPHSKTDTRRLPKSPKDPKVSAAIKRKTARTVRQAKKQAEGELPPYPANWNLVQTGEDIVAECEETRAALRGRTSKGDLSREAALAMCKAKIASLMTLIRSERNRIPMVQNTMPAPVEYADGLRAISERLQRERRKIDKMTSPIDAQPIEINPEDFELVVLTRRDYERLLAKAGRPRDDRSMVLVS